MLVFLQNLSSVSIPNLIKMISRKQFLLVSATAVGGIGIVLAERFFNSVSSNLNNLSFSFSNQSFLPIINNQPNIYDWIREEAIALNNESNHPLPLLGSWNASTWWNYNETAAGLSPLWQLEMVDQSHHFLPWFNLPRPDPDC